MEEVLMTVREIAARSRKAVKTIYFYVETGVIPATLVIRLGHAIHMRPADFEKWIESNRGIDVNVKERPINQRRTK